MLTYAMRLTSRYDGLVVATFPDVPDAVGYGRDDQEACEEGHKALEAVLQGLVDAGEPLPAPVAASSLSVTTTRFAPETAAAQPAIELAAIS
jgi:predicted RNase H-like HicB family nuclease